MTEDWGEEKTKKPMKRGSLGVFCFRVKAKKTLKEKGMTELCNKQ